jgi:hypothetical protein
MRITSLNHHERNDMKKLLTMLAAIILIMPAMQAIAGPATDALSTCLADNTTR